MLYTQILKMIPVMMILAGGCHKNNLLLTTQKLNLPDHAAAVVTAQNQFALKLFQGALQNDPAPANKLVSPLSIYLDLSMAYNGAAGSTQAAMGQALQLNHVTIEQLNNTNEALVKGLPNMDNRVTLDIANSIWYHNQGLQPLPTFLKTNSTHYDAQVIGADFTPATLTQINNWVASQTKQKIKTILQQIDPGDVMYLINAVYFKGQWKNSFDPKLTVSRPFSTGDQNTVQAPFMHTEDKFNYLQNDSLQMIELPYGNGHFNMYVLLPGVGLNLTQVLSSLNENTIMQYIGSLDSVKVKLWLPKWKYSYTIADLKPELNSMGMGAAFSEQADFSAMYPPDAKAYISKVVHKTYIEVNEEGTEAAAVTSTGMTTTAAPIHIPPVMDVNRPFLYLITEKESRAILFVGVINNPAMGQN